MKIELEVPDVIEYEGKRYRPTGEYRFPKRWDACWGGCGVFIAGTDYIQVSHIILEQIPEPQKARNAIKPFEHNGRWFFADCGKRIVGDERTLLGCDASDEEYTPWLVGNEDCYDWEESVEIIDDDTRQLVYLASPYSHKDRNIRMLRLGQACEYAASQIGLGRKLYSPIAANYPIAEHMGGSCWETWKEYDLFMLAMSSKLEVLKLDGWEDSVGVQAEIAFAQEKGIPIVYVDWQGN